MIVKLIFGLALLIALFTLYGKYQRAPKTQQKKWLLSALFVVVVVAILAGALTGRVPLVAGLAAIAATLFKLGWRFGLPAYRLWLAKSGGNACFNSDYLRINVNINNGQMQGTVLKGEFADKTLAQLTPEQLQQLQTFFNQQDKKSYYLLTAYLRSRGFAHFKDTPNPDPETATRSSSRSELSVNEAMEILGFTASGAATGAPTKEDIISAHRRLMAKLHPDKGGSDYLAARVNLAREVLIKQFHQG